MKDKYCLPIIKSSSADVLAEIKASEANYGFYEIWLDYVKDLNDEFISNLLASYSGKLVFVFRRKNLDKPKLSLERQLDILQILDSQDCLTDLDVYDQKKLIEKSKSLNLKRIISYHNYKETPDEDKLNKILDDISTRNPEIIKISTFCSSKSDALVLLKLMLELKAWGKKHIVLGMGEHGLITRLYGTLWGNELTFITEKKEDSSAPGQLTRLEFEKFLKEQL